MSFCFPTPLRICLALITSNLSTTITSFISLAVFDMISRVYNGSDWTSTLLEVIPKRKNAKPRIEVQKVTFKSESKPALDSSDVQDEKPPVSKETTDSSTSTLTM